MSSILEASLVALVNMVIAYIAFAVAFGGFSWPVQHGDIFCVVLYHTTHILLCFLGNKFSSR